MEIDSISYGNRGSEGSRQCHPTMAMGKGRVKGEADIEGNG